MNVVSEWVLSFSKTEPALTVSVIVCAYNSPIRKELLDSFSLEIVGLDSLLLYFYEDQTEVAYSRFRAFLKTSTAVMFE